MARILSIAKRALTAGLAAVVLAAAGVSTARQIGMVPASEDGVPPDEGIAIECPAADEEATDAPEDQIASEAEADEDGCPEDPADDEDETDETPGPETDHDPEAQVTGEREAACAEAAGSTTGADTGGEAGTGLDRAIAAVSANCVKNPQAPGLINALEQLAKNRDRLGGEDDGRGRGKKRKGKRSEVQVPTTPIEGLGISSGAQGRGNGKGRGKG